MLKRCVRGSVQRGTLYFKVSADYLVLSYKHDWNALLFQIVFQKYSFIFLISYLSPLLYLPHLLSRLPSPDWFLSASLLSPAVLSAGIITHAPAIIFLNHQLVFLLATLLRLQLLFTVLQISFCNLPFHYLSHAYFGCHLSRPVIFRTLIIVCMSLCV